MTETDLSLLEFFKALSDATRLKILGLLARQELSVEQLAEILALRPSTVSHHLQILTHVGLVRARAESYYNIYSLQVAVLQAYARQLGSPETLRLATAGLDLDAYDRKVLASFTTSDGRLKTLPAQRKKFEVILRYVLRDFVPAMRYSEKQVNDLLGHYHEDTATLRRELVGYGWLKRTAGGAEYWREKDEPAT
jgi:hypothetical protein